MPDSVSPAQAVLEALGFAIFLRDGSGALRLEGNSPAWLRALWPEVATAKSNPTIEKASPFLENFLVDAAACWAGNGEDRVRSGPWVEQAADGSAVTLEATALRAGEREILLLERQGEAFEAKRSVLQKARETAIAYQRLNAEMQKKEILLSCIADEMNAALANTITSLRLLELEQNPARMRSFLALAGRATEEQQGLINRVLRVFADELEELYGQRGRANVGDALATALENVAPQFADKNVRLKISDGDEVSVAMTRDHLARVISNLLENALQNSPADAEVELKVTDEAETVSISVFDRGTAIPREISRRLFSRSDASDGFSLQFCRVAVEKCRGEIGCETSETGGNCFWIRVPKAEK